jgi:hypothetical protein
MNRVSVKPYGNLIAASLKKGDEFDAGVESVTSPMVARALQKQKEQDEEMLQSEIVSAFDCARVKREEKVQMIRALRKQIDSAKKDLDRLDKAEELAKTSGDFRPLLVLTGNRVSGFDASEWTK